MKNITIVALLIVLVVAGVLLCRTWTWSVPFATTFSVKVVETWNDEQPWVNKVGVWSAAMPELTQQINSRDFLAQLKQMLLEHPITREWTTENTKLQPAQLSPGGPLIVNCETLAYGIRRWSLLRQGGGRDTERSDHLKRDLQSALQELLSGKES